MTIRYTAHKHTSVANIQLCIHKDMRKMLSELIQADVWSLGITVIEMAQNKLPYGDLNIMRVSLFFDILFTFLPRRSG